MAPPLPLINVEVVFASPEQQLLKAVRVADGCTAAAAIEAAGMHSLWQSASGQQLPLARFGRLISGAQALGEGDRVEILRPLLADPKDQRHQRVRAAKRARRRAA